MRVYARSMIEKFSYRALVYTLRRCVHNNFHKHTVMSVMHTANLVHMHVDMTTGCQYFIAITILNIFACTDIDWLLAVLNTYVEYNSELYIDMHDLYIHRYALHMYGT